MGKEGGGRRGGSLARQGFGAGGCVTYAVSEEVEVSRAISRQMLQSVVSSVCCVCVWRACNPDRVPHCCHCHCFCCL